MKTGNIIQVSLNDTSDVSVFDMGNEWLKSVKIKVKQSTYAKYHYTLTNHLKNELGCIPLKKLNNTIVMEYTNTLIDKGLKSKTVKDILSILAMVLKYYKKNYNSSFVIEIVYPRVEKKVIDVLNNTEIESLEKHICNDTDSKKLGLLLTLYTGLRVGEICSLRWEDINLTEGYISINKTIQRIKDIERIDGAKTKVVIDTPKSQSSIRQIPIPDFIIPMLYKYKSSGKTYFLTGESEFVEPRTYQNYFKKCLKENQIRDTNFHTLRHTFATRCITSGCDVKSLSEILGHSSVKITLDLYVHPNFEMKKASINKVVPLSLPVAI